GDDGPGVSALSRRSGRDPSPGQHGGSGPGAAAPLSRPTGTRAAGARAARGTGPYRVPDSGCDARRDGRTGGMMAGNPDRLYNLLPALYREKDAEEGYPLQALLRIIT